MITPTDTTESRRIDGAQHGGERRSHESATEASATWTAGLRRRAPWRQRLVDAEFGFVQAMRADSALFVQVFIILLVALTAAVLQISLLEWAILAMSFAQLVGAELVRYALRARTTSPTAPEVRIAAAAVMVMFVGAAIVTGCILGPRLLVLVR